MPIIGKFMVNKIKNFIFRILYLLIVVYLVTFIPSLWGYKPLVVISGSMEPTLKVGSILYYHKENIDSFHQNDILVYQTKHHIISHRIVDILDNGFMTKGDANQSIDSGRVYHNQILGKGTNWCIPLLGYYTDYIYHHKYLLYISVFLLIIDLYIDFYKKQIKKVGEINEKTV